MHACHSLSNPIAVDVLERFSVSKRGSSDGGGDRLVEGPRYFGVIDAATDKSGAQWSFEGQNVSGEFVMAEILSRAINGSVEDIDTILPNVQSRIASIAQDAGVNLLDSATSPLACFVLLDTKKGDLIVLGDCGYGLVANGQLAVNYNSKKVDELAAECRALAYLGLKGGGDASGGPDPGRSVILDDLQRATQLANADPNSFGPNDTLFGQPMSDLVFPVFDIRTPPTLPRVPLPKGVSEVILTSDGYPEILRTLQATEANLQRSLVDDPLRIMDHPATKGLVAGQVSFDDRTYLRLLISSRTGR